MNMETGSLDGQLPLHGVGDRLRMAREQAGIAPDGGERAQVVLGDEEHARACGVGQAGVEAGIAHGVVSWLISNRRKLS